MFLLGDWSHAETYAQRGWDVLRTLDMSWFGSYPPLLLARIKATRGDFEAAASLLDEGLSLAAEGSHSLYVIGLSFAAEMDLFQGEPARAISRLDQFLARDDVEKEDALLTPALFFLAWAHLECGHVDTAHELAQLSIKKLEEENSIIELLIARRVAGMISAARGEYELATSTFDHVISVAREVRYPHAEACALYEYGMMDVRRGNSSEALSRLGAALQIFQKLGAKPYIERAQRALTSTHADGRAPVAAVETSSD
jgi:ATP/maltotriose-dependent transcriptional regulator MalT